MNEREFFNIISEGRSISEVIEIIDEIVEMIKEDPEGFVSDLEWLKDERCKEEACCPKCGYSLEIVDEYEESRGEYWGAPAYESISIYGCSNCNYIEE